MAVDDLNYRPMNVQREAPTQDSLEHEADMLMFNNNNAMNCRPMSREEAREIVRQRRMVKPPQD